MKYLSTLTEDDIRYICSVIPLDHSICYFKMYPKDFAKIMPGFRATSMKNQTQVTTLLFRFRNKPFILSFIENHVSSWLRQIKDHITQRIAEGDSRESALLNTLPFCFFVDNIGLYFKLIKEEHSTEYITLLRAAIKLIKESDGKREELTDKLKGKNSEIEMLQAKLKIVEIDLVKAKAKFEECSDELKELEHATAKLEELRSIVHNKEEAIIVLKTKLQAQERLAHKLEIELFAAKDSYNHFEIYIKKKLEKRQAIIVERQKNLQSPKYPIDIEEFKDCLGYNLANIGIPADAVYFNLLREHLSHILFQGIPIVANHSCGMPLIKCIANALTGTQNTKKLSFSKEISTQDIEDFLSENGRIVCLDNFIGNFNETELIPLFAYHKDKIIFLTISYDKTLHYVSEEFFCYCHYLNLNRIKALLSDVELTEDPSELEEIVASPPRVSLDNRYSQWLNEILKEFSFRQRLIRCKCAFVSNEQDLCCVLAFDILPYCVDVLQIAPYNTSERFVQYANSVRDPYKKLLMGWFV